MRIFLFLLTLSFAAEPSQRYNLITTADLLYWTAREDGLAYVRDGVLPIGTNVDVLKRKDTQFAMGNWDVGFRVGMGLQLDHESWTALFQYSRLTTSDSGNRVGDMAPTWTIGGIEGVSQGNLNVGLQIGQASADWDYIYNNFVLELGKQFGYFTPHIGMTATWQKQTYNVSYAQFGNMEEFTELRSNMKHNNWGIGARSGVHSKWMFNNTWGFYGDAAIAALWTRFQVAREDTALEPDGQIVTPVHNVSDFHTLKAFLDLSLGLYFTYATPSDSIQVSGNIGWEEQVWFNENQFTQLFSAGGNQGDLTLQGLTISCRIDY
jgi:hypothetical protein